MDGPDGYSSPESEEEAFSRKRTPAKAFTLPKAPLGTGFRAWVGEAYFVMEAASNRRKARTRKFAQSVELCSVEQSDRLLEISPRWEQFDSELLVAVTVISPADLSRELVNKREMLQRQGKFLSGRLALWTFYQQYRLDTADCMQVDLTSLWKLEYSGDLQLCLSALDSLLLNSNQQPDAAMVSASVLPQLRKCKSLAPAFV